MDRKSNVIRPAIMHTDIRAASQLLYLNEILDPPITHGFLLPKLLWVRDKENSHYGNIQKFLFPIVISFSVLPVNSAVMLIRQLYSEGYMMKKQAAGQAGFVPGWV